MQRGSGGRRSAVEWLNVPRRRRWKDGARCVSRSFRRLRQWPRCMSYGVAWLDQRADSRRDFVLTVWRVERSLASITVGGWWQRLTVEEIPLPTAANNVSVRTALRRKKIAPSSDVCSVHVLITESSTWELSSAQVRLLRLRAELSSANYVLPCKRSKRGIGRKNRNSTRTRSSLSITPHTNRANSPTEQCESNGVMHTQHWQDLSQLLWFLFWSHFFWNTLYIHNMQSIDGHPNFTQCFATRQ